MYDQQLIVEMLRNLADNIEAKHVEVTDFFAAENDQNVSELRLLIFGEPKILPEHFNNTEH